MKGGPGQCGAANPAVRHPSREVGFDYCFSPTLFFDPPSCHFLPDQARTSLRREDVKSVEEGCLSSSHRVTIALCHVVSSLSCCDAERVLQAAPLPSTRPNFLDRGHSRPSEIVPEGPELSLSDYGREHIPKIKITFFSNQRSILCIGSRTVAQAD